MAREQIREILIIARDLDMAQSIKEQVDKGEQRGLVQFADGESIKVPVPAEVGIQLDNKIDQLVDLLQAKVAALRK